MIYGNVEVNTNTLLESIDPDDMINYLYDEKKISHQVVKKYFKIKDIDFRPSKSYWTRLDLDDLGIIDDDILDNMSEDDIYEYLKNQNYIFPSNVKTEDWDDEFDPRTCEHNEFVDYIEELMKKRYGHLSQYKDLKEKLCEIIDSYGYNHT